jgi:hypothetical protein
LLSVLSLTIHIIFEVSPMTNIVHISPGFFEW